ncbi:multidrug efflux pump subunit AcrA (membrane-fusion protein) [Okibacterium sp. HSC-33S16]|uniref:HlyD family efflux transporter periplasmic adaptor subunit n=1 Tax=Okibacterium sp. HSC-33S16 TaxID=2910965 RepID=UPI00209FAE90|nr:HlyD family efflux transporter periplasmic adaptor subunit [Okibacterium sp. HSC-33S16]MCP2031932.1 multidrug efflux pump subunit AcrA (membrane-fusion protein) [Okibacterium sp. HSC-33S16]
MGVWRKWIFPILRIAIFAIIAVALVKVAFFPDASAEADPAVPTGSITEPVTEVTLGSIATTVVVDGSVSADPASPGKATLAGEISAVSVAEGQAVNAGDALGTVRQEIPQEPVATTDADGNVTMTQPKPKYKTAAVTAPVSGVVSSVPVLVGQIVAVGDVVATVAPPTFSVTGPIRPEDQFKLVEQPADGQVEVIGGPGAFTCTGLTISSPLAGTEAPVADPGSAPATGASGATVRCAVPADIRVFAGLTAKLTLAGGSVDDALTLPITAVKGNAATGTVWVVNTDGASEERAVSLGLNDGTRVQITEGIAEGDEVLEFVPVVDATDPADENCIEQPDGSVYCDESAVG